MTDTKQFNLEHAKAGAPFCTLSDESVEILKWDMKWGNCPLLGIVGDEQLGARWAADGEPNGASPSNYRLVMTPLGYINGKPVFVGDEIEMKCFAPPNEWKLVAAEPGWAGTWNDDGKCVRWPEPEDPADKLLTEFRRWAGDDPGYAAQLIRSAADEIDRLRAARSERDLAVAKYIRHRCYTSSQQTIGKLDLATLIAEVKA